MNIRGVRLVRPFFPHKFINQVAVDTVFEAMQGFFEQWGTPLALRVDNGLPFGSSDLSITPALSLTLIGYGIEVKTNRPHTPQQNGKVERQQGTSSRWAEIEKCPDLDAAQKQLDKACLIQREKYPVTRLKGKTRIQAFPQLSHKDRLWKEQGFDTQRVYEFLAKKTYVRKVSTHGQITHFAQAYYLGTAYKNESVVLKFNAFLLTWECYSAQGTFIKALKTDQFSEYKLKNFTVFSKN